MKKPPYDLPVNTLKRESSVQELLHLRSHKTLGILDYAVIPYNNRIHRNNVKVKFFLVGFRKVTVHPDTDPIYKIGKWVELEPYQTFYEMSLINDTVQGIVYPFDYFITYTNQLVQSANAVILNVETSTGEVCEIWIEKISVIDSDFNSQVGWTNPYYENNILELLQPPAFFPDLPHVPYEPPAPHSDQYYTFSSRR